MQFPVFEHAYLLQSIGWAIANSFWQTGSLWLSYQLITAVDKQLTAQVRHHLAILLLYTSLIWFSFTIYQNYRMLSDATSPQEVLAIGYIVAPRLLQTILPILSVLYLLVLSFFAACFIKSFSSNRLLRKKGLGKVALDFRLFTHATAVHLGIKRKVQVWLSANIDVPCVTGFIKPVILLPAAIINHLSIEQTEAILVHELGHIKRNDYLVNLLQSFAELILFFNPFAVFLGKAAKKERENCCDDWVMNFQYDRYEYANALLILEEQRHQREFPFALASTNGKKSLLCRVKRLFTTHPHTGFSFSQKLKLTSLSVLLLVTVFTAVPVLLEKPFTHESGRVHIKRPNLANIGKMPVANSEKKVFTARPKVPLPTGTTTAPGNKSRKKAYQYESKDYVNALINQELLNASGQIEPVVTRLPGKDVKDSTYLVKIEERQSGKKQTNTYYFELKSTNGMPALKPLIMLKKFRVIVGPKIISLPEKVDTTMTVRPKKRVTS